MVTAVVRVALLIKSNQFICVFAGIFCCNFASGSGGNSSRGGSSLAPTTTTTTSITTTSATTITTSFITSFTTKQALKYGTSGDVGGSGIGWVVIVMAVMVDY